MRRIRCLPGRRLRYCITSQSTLIQTFPQHRVSPSSIHSFIYRAGPILVSSTSIVVKLKIQRKNQLTKRRNSKIHASFSNFTMQTYIALALAVAELAAAHTTFQSIVVDGEDQGQHYAVRTPSNGNNPIYDVTSTAMICNGGSATDETVEVAAGSTIGLQWHHNDPMTESGDSDEPIAASHKGPVMVYMAPAESNGEGAVWTKIYEDGLEGGEWGVDRFIANAGLIEVTLPDLADGDYLIRPEMIGLHEATREEGAQFYNGCGQLKVTGGSTSLPSSGTDMTKAYSASDPGVLVDIYNSPTSYEIPGPAVWDGASSGSGSGSGTTPSTPTSSSAPAASSATPSTPVTSSSPTTSAQPTASVIPAGESYGSSSSLPDSFTAEELIAYVETNARTPEKPKRFNPFLTWFKQQSGASSKTRRHARAFDF